MRSEAERIMSTGTEGDRAIGRLRLLKILQRSDFKEAKQAIRGGVRCGDQI